jgi:hypothetical protein
MLNSFLLKPGIGCGKSLTNSLNYSTAKAETTNTSGIKTKNLKKKLLFAFTSATRRKLAVIGERSDSSTVNVVL